MVTVLPEPDAANVPGNAVAPVSAAQLAEEAVCVAFTTPAVPVQVVESAPFIFTETVVAPAPAVLKTSRADVTVLVAMRLIRRYEFDKDAAAARPCQASRPPSITNADAATDNMRIDFFIFFPFCFLVVKPMITISKHFVKVILRNIYNT